MSKEANSQYLLEVKHEYSRQLCNLLVPVMYEGIHSIYTEATKNKKDTPMKIFQILLSRIPQWNQHIITNEYQRILNKTQCDFISDLITAVFISHAKILSSVKSKKKSKTLNLKVPNGDYFIHKAYIECARYFWKNPYLFCDNISTIEYQRNMREAESIIEQSINETVRKLLPVKNILQQYINLDESSSSDSSSSSSSESNSDDDDAKNKKKKNKSTKYANESDTDPDAVVTKESIREKQYITNNMTDRDKKHLEKMVKTTLASTPKDVSIVEQPDADADGCFSMYSIGDNLHAKEVSAHTHTIEPTPVINDIKTVVISPTNSFMNGVEEITFNDFNMDGDITAVDNYDTIDMGCNAEDVEINETAAMDMNGDDICFDEPPHIENNIDMNICMPEPIIDIFTKNTTPTPIEQNYSALLPKPSSIISDNRSMNSIIDAKLDCQSEDISKKKTEVSTKSVSATINTPGIIKNITITQPADAQPLTRQPVLKKRTELPLSTPKGGGNPKYSFF